jgi:hypothetical protein
MLQIALSREEARHAFPFEVVKAEGWACAIGSAIVKNHPCKPTSAIRSAGHGASHEQKSIAE